MTSADEVRELLGIEPQRHFIGAEGVGGKNAEMIRVMDALSARASRSSLEVAQKSGLALERTEAVLGILSLEGEIVQGNGGWRKRPSG